MVLGILLAVVSEAGAAAGAPEQSDDKSVTESTEQPPEPGRPRLLKPMPVTPESRRELQELAATLGTDPTAIVGFYQLGYVHSRFVQGHLVDSAIPVVALAVTPSWVLRVAMPYVWDNPNQRGLSNQNGANDMVVRTGLRVYHSSYLALFVGTDVVFPTASSEQLGFGKYNLGPGFAVSVPMPRLRSILFVLPQTFFSVGGNGSRPDTHSALVQTALNTLWSERWWTILEMDVLENWNLHGQTGATLQGEVGYRWDEHWRFFVRPGVGLWGKDVGGAYDWNVQCGVRWMIPGSIFSKALFEGFKGD